MRCGHDGVPVAVARSGRLIHLDELPQDMPEHEIIPIADGEFEVAVVRKIALREAASDMLSHHAALHPESDCEWARNLRLALRS